MRHEKIDLYDFFRKEKKGTGGFLTSYIHADLSGDLGHKVFRPAILVIPGGGYGFVSGREGEPIAEKFFSVGYNAYVLDYSVGKQCYPAPLIEAGMAMLYIRETAKIAFTLKNKVAVIGFSAGGHLAGMVSLLNENAEMRGSFGSRCGELRPDACIYSYSVVSANNEIWHQGSFENLCGEKYDFGAFSLENEVTSSAPPAFIWATMDDGAVPARNSFVLAEAYAKAGVPCELHIYESGFHGLSTCQYDVSFDYMPSEEQLKRVAAWMPACFAFLKDKGFYPQRIK